MMELESVPSTARTVSPRAPKMETKTGPRPAAEMARKIAQLRQPAEQKAHRTTLPTSKTEFSKR